MYTTNFVMQQLFMNTIMQTFLAQVSAAYYFTHYSCIASNTTHQHACHGQVLNKAHAIKWMKRSLQCILIANRSFFITKNTNDIIIYNCSKLMCILAQKHIFTGLAHTFTLLLCATMGQHNDKY